MDLEPPDGWAWGYGTIGENYYDRWLYQQGDESWEGHLYWDGKLHTAEFIDIIDEFENGDKGYGYRECWDCFETEEEAIEWLLQKAEELSSSGE